MSNDPVAEHAAFTAMVAEQLPTVTAYARRRVRDPDDVVSEVFATAWRWRDRLPDPVRPWLLKVASHHVLHSDRAEMRRGDLVARTATVRGTGVADDHADATLERLDAATRVDAALGRLRPLDREVLRLSAWEQLTTGEIAVVLDCTTTAAKVRLHRARRRLAAVLSARDADDAPAALDELPQHGPATTRTVTTREVTS